MRLTNSIENWKSQAKGVFYMVICSIKNMEEGMILGKSIYQYDGKLLLKAGYPVSSTIKEKLIERGYNHVYVEEEGTEQVSPEDVISDEIKFHAKVMLADKVDMITNQAALQNVSQEKAKNLLDEGYLRKVNITHDLRNIVDDILKDILSVGAKFLNTMMIKTKDSLFLDHAVNVTVLAILIGKKYKFDRKELMDLALGTFLHDIGKIIIEQREEYGDPTKAEELYKEHSTFGYLLLNNSNDVSPIEKQIVNQHHESQDGKGFPTGLKGQNLSPQKTVKREMKGHIFRMAEICCVADAFENLLYNPVDETPKAPNEAVKEIIVNSGKLYNRDIVQTLLGVIPVLALEATDRCLNSYGIPTFF